jgi:hypothetical protein
MVGSKHSSLVLVALLLSGVACSKRQDKADPETVPDPDGTVQGGQGQPPAGTGTETAVATTGTVVIKGAPQSALRLADEALTLEELSFEVASVELSTDGKDWTTVDVAAGGTALDVVAGDGEITLADVPPGVYTHVVLHVALPVSGRRSGDACKATEFIEGDDVDSVGVAFVSAEVASDSGQSFAYPTWDPAKAPEDFYEPATHARFSQLAAPFEVTAGATTSLVVSMNPAYEERVTDCEGDLETPVLVLGESDAHDEAHAKIAEERAWRDGLIASDWQETCNGSGSEYKQQSVSFKAPTDDQPFPSFSWKRAQYSDAGCTTEFFHLEEIYAPFAVGPTIEHDEDDVHKLDLTLRQSLFAITDADAIAWANENAYCGFTDWQAGVAQDVTGIACEDDEEAVAAGTKTYAVLRVDDETLYLGGTVDDATDGTTPETRSTDTSSNVFNRVP